MRLERPGIFLLILLLIPITYFSFNDVTCHFLEKKRIQFLVIEVEWECIMIETAVNFAINGMMALIYLVMEENNFDELWCVAYTIRHGVNEMYHLLWYYK